MSVLPRPRFAAPRHIGSPLTSRAELWVLVASLAAAAGIHLAVGFEHEFGGVHGTFFLVAGAIQGIGAYVLARRPSRSSLVVVLLGSAALLTTWLVQRTPGLPGGDAIDPLATATAVAEAVSVVASMFLFARPVTGRGRIPGIAALAFVALVAVGSGGLANDDHADHHHPGEEVISDATSPGSSNAPEPLRPLPVAPTGSHHGRAADGGGSDVDASMEQPMEQPPARASGDGHHDTEGAPPHDH